MVGREFGQVVDDPRADGDGDGIRPGQEGVELLDEAPFGVKRRVGEQAGGILGDAGLFEKAVHLLAGHTPRIGVGNDYGPVPGEELRKEFRHAGKCPDAEYHGPGIGCPRQSAFNFIHDELFWVT